MLRASQVDLPHVLEKFGGTFDTLWNDSEFEPFDPAEDLERLQDAIARERGGRTPTSPLRFFAHLAPYPFQEEILDRLRVEREVHQRHRNLVVAATGTGKTLIAAFDYARQIPDSGVRPRLLFVAHRDELLRPVARRLSPRAARRRLRPAPRSRLRARLLRPPLHHRAELRLARPRPAPRRRPLGLRGGGRVPPRHRRHLARGRRTPRAQAAARPHRHPRALRRRAHHALLLSLRRRRGAPLARPRPPAARPLRLLRARRRDRPAPARVAPRGLRRRGPRRRLHRQRPPRRAGAGAAAPPPRQPRPDARARLLRQRRSRRVHGAQVHRGRPPRRRRARQTPPTRFAARCASASSAAS